MKKTVTILILCLVSTFSFAQDFDEFGNIISSHYHNIKPKAFKLLKSNKSNPANIIKAFPCPNSSSKDIAFDGLNLWMASSDNLIYKISPMDGSILKVITLSTDYANGLTFDGANLWVTDMTNQLLIQLDTSDGNVLQQFTLNNDGAAGLAWGNSNIWNNNNKQGSSVGDTTFNISSSSGAIIDYFLPFGQQPSGLAFDGTYLWSSDNYSDEIYKIDLASYTIIDTIDAPGGGYPNGLTFDGQYLWVANNDADSLYQIDIGFTPTSLNDFSNKSGQIIVYPNPSSGCFIIKGNLITSNRPLSINIYDIVGHEIFTKPLLNDNSDIINLDSFKSGLFFYTISNKNGILESGKLVKE